MRTCTTLFVLVLRGATCLSLGFACGCCPRDEGKDLVNAAGLPSNAVLQVLRAGADVNKPSRTTFGWTPLISAIYHHNEGSVDVLLASGVDVNVDDPDPTTPLSWAIITWGDNTNLIVKLLRSGADPTVRNRFGADAFSQARSLGNSGDVLRILQVRGGTVAPR
jgi:ankyrin repeat protein